MLSTIRQPLARIARHPSSPREVAAGTELEDLGTFLNLQAGRSKSLELIMKA
jgi:hypothetical protein